MIQISPAGAAFPPGVDVPGLEAAAGAALTALGFGDAELSVVLGADADIIPLNASWRGRAEPTDVLSFPQHEFPDGPGVLPIGAPPVLGDVFVSVETAGRQAAEHGHGLQRELVILLVHGLCHLLGWDHEDPADAAEMRAVEARILAELGAPTPGLIERAGA